MVLGSHVIFGVYGFWLPNDERGSWSEFVGAWELYRYGPATKTAERRSLAARHHNVAARMAAKRALKRPAVHLSGIQARAVGRGFAEYSADSGLSIWACAILPDHIHLVLGRHRLKVEQLAIQLKGAASRHPISEGIHPFGDYAMPHDTPPKCFAVVEWKVYLTSDEDIERSVKYVELNPLKEGKPLQHWKFVRRPF